VGNQAVLPSVLILKQLPNAKNSSKMAQKQPILSHFLHFLSASNRSFRVLCLAPAGLFSFYVRFQQDFPHFSGLFAYFVWLQPEHLRIFYTPADGVFFRCLLDAAICRLARRLFSASLQAFTGTQFHSAANP
jgi:hypothetical protein